MAIVDPSINEIINENQAAHEALQNEIHSEILSHLSSALEIKNSELAANEQHSSEELGLIEEQLQQGISTSIADGVSDSISVLFSALEKVAEKGDPQLASDIKFKSILKTLPLLGTTVSIAIDVHEGDDLQEAVVKEFAGAIAGMIAGAAVTAGAALTIAALPEISLGGAAVAVLGALGVGATLAVEYLAANWTTAEVGDQWHYFLGPNYNHYYDSEINELTLEIKNGNVSDALRNYWQGGNSIVDKNIFEEDLEFENLDYWVIAQITPEQIPFEIRFDNSTENFQFIVEGVSSLRGFANTNAEYKEIVDLILEKFPQDFEVAVGAEGAAFHQIRNYYSEATHGLIALEALDDAFAGATQNKAIFALVNLYSFVEDGVDDYSSINPDDYSEQYLKDRAAFLFYHMHEGSFSDTPDDMQYKDYALGIEAYAGNGTPDLTDRHYLFGTEGIDTLEGRGKEDHLYGSSPKVFSPHRAVFEMVAED